MRTSQRLARSVSRWALVRWLTSIVIKLVWALSRIWSHLRFRALVPQAGDAVCHWTVEIKVPTNLTIGDRVRIGPYAVLGAAAPIIIEDDVAIARGALIETGGVDWTKPLPYPYVSKPIKIERGALIATGAIVLGGVTIGERAVIGAGAVITRDIPPFAVVNVAPNRIFIRKESHGISVEYSEKYEAN